MRAAVILASRQPDETAISAPPFAYHAPQRTHVLKNDV
jgi:hypothetical protein